MLFEKDKLYSKQKDVAAVFNKHFGSITDSLNLFSWSKNTMLMSSENDTTNSIIKKFAFHRSTKTIKQKIKSKSKFSLNHVSIETIKRMIYEYLQVKR